MLKLIEIMLFILLTHDCIISLLTHDCIISLPTHDCIISLVRSVAAFFFSRANLGPLVTW